MCSPAWARAIRPTDSTNSCRGTGQLIIAPPDVQRPDAYLPRRWDPFQSPALHPIHLLSRHHRAPENIQPVLPRTKKKPGSADRKRVVTGKSVSVRVDLGGRRNITNKKLPTNTQHKQLT